MRVPRPALRILEKRYRATKDVMAAVNTLLITHTKIDDGKVVILDPQECYIEKDTEELLRKAGIVYMVHYIF